MNENNLEKIVLGGGCFWCMEGIFQRVPGVVKVVSGYAGGFVESPSYEQVSEETTGHAEVVEVEFDESRVSLGQILEIFFLLHDPTTLNRQGADVGSQYRSAIYYEEESQLPVIRDLIEKAKTYYAGVVTTEVKRLERFYKAEDYHQNYYNDNKDTNPYCKIVIEPKVQKLIELIKLENTGSV